MEYGMYLSLPVDQSDSVLIAPGQVSSVEFMVEHTGSAGIQMDVEFELFTSLPSSWSDPIWDQPAGYSLAGVAHSRSQLSQLKLQTGTCQLLLTALRFGLEDLSRMKITSEKR